MDNAIISAGPQSPRPTGTHLAFTQRNCAHFPLKPHPSGLIPARSVPVWPPACQIRTHMSSRPQSLHSSVWQGAALLQEWNSGTLPFPCRPGGGTHPRLRAVPSGAASGPVVATYVYLGGNGWRPAAAGVGAGCSRPPVVAGINSGAAVPGDYAPGASRLGSSACGRLRTGTQYIAIAVALTVVVLTRVGLTVPTATQTQGCIV